MIIDDLTIRIKAGKGGNGIIAFNKNKGALGPTGGRGGNGGDIYFIGVSDLGALNALRNTKVFHAEDGKNGRHQLNDGTAGEDMIIQIPVGTVIHNLTTGTSPERSREGTQRASASYGTSQEIVRVGEQILAAKGGHGGKGNFLFRGPHSTSPMRFQEGLPGEQFNIRLELKMIADVGLIGLPNVGKSSLLNELTKAKSKVANYHFTTLEPHLGSYYGLILADIPGLIEGASEGKGLGVKFLRHIERTRVLFHLVSAESEDPVKDYKSIRNELGAYNKALLEKDEYLFLSKTDLLDAKIIKGKLAKLKKLNKKAVVLSIHDVNAIDLVQKILNKIAQEKEI
ncbi:MAG: Obg family GTPase CgtA [Candidatus Yanofskybacteria bacterium RIFCSPHIGHO2_01_FULL_41_27]|uniref:GTPase Obg n=2 Tax=Candidatus Yanofskyibacteriota TaxID=1752733 RepID=A0A1F8HTC9_9BACT|nr:MAG: Obg family GTPase CgtA [Candidatus Yanofskybacteria bacterium RIFCSPHIGHO2_01_FULL_41_27]OGN09366.1 MAG: Obg family GTPase CgtA [Candidatus Yanofskybacteria bacterium RIFCSPHIGHO2_02_FULL_41_12]OGN40837.1 MAG: Obg family GTPase CgtA [Candidatus Yanofskybacteria bacterium RIFOXYD1_FULL_42_10]